MNTLQGKRIVLTGASSGIGKALMQELVAQGCQIVAASRSMEKTSPIAENVYHRNCDVSKPEELDALFAYATEKMGGIDIYIANAGFAYYESLQKADWQHIARIMETNVFSVCYAAVKMKEISEGKPFQFMCTASAMSFWSLPGYSLYSSTKAALHGFAQSFRYELAPQQHFQMVYPIATKTNFFDGSNQTPTPWPTQTAEHVASRMVKALMTKQKTVHPSPLFTMTRFLNQFLPFIRSIYLQKENKRFQVWLGGRTHE